MILVQRPVPMIMLIQKKVMFVIIHVLSILHKSNKNHYVQMNVVLEIYQAIHTLMKSPKIEYNVSQIAILLQINIYKLMNAYILVNQIILNQ